ncbi:MotA/TolQ/ExbB proton channel family protein [Actinobacillus pleuropneumoniae]|uniref:MotA/TolQ/ExbB proton channel family protein n=1 Tax=Actinobacillus pleuropneumoniae TaxID=715 RepID=UPI003B288C8A
MITFIENYLKSLPAESITNYFFYLMLGITTFNLFLFFALPNIRESFRSRILDYAPTLLTSLGILGTFTGIVSGLLNFDIENIDNSITELLSGMKTAFLTSVIGVTLSISLKVIFTLFKKKNKKSDENNSMDIKSIVNTLFKQTEYLKLQTEKSDVLADNLQAMVKMLGSESDGSLLGQVKLLRSDLSDQQKSLQKTFTPMAENLEKILNSFNDQKQIFSNFENKLWIKLQDFADMMSKSATEAVIDALKKVIQDFNNNLTEQFGENFKQLNLAVINLVEWQENYKNQLNEMISLYNSGIQSLTTTETAISNIENSTQSIPTTMEKLDMIIRSNQQQIDQLDGHLKSFAQLRDKAVEAIPEVQKQISAMLENVNKANSDLTQGLKESGEKLQQHIANTSDKLGQSITETSQKLGETANLISTQNKELTAYQKQLFEQITQFASRWNHEFNDNVKRIHEAFNHSVEEMIKSQVSENRKLMLSLEKESENALKSTAESVQKQLDLIDKSMQEEINRVMKEMGGALAAIANKFTDDYVRLTEQMAKVVQQNNRDRF